MILAAAPRAATWQCLDMPPRGSAAPNACRSFHGASQTAPVGAALPRRRLSAGHSCSGFRILRIMPRGIPLVLAPAQSGGVQKHYLSRVLARADAVKGSAPSPAAPSPEVIESSKEYTVQPGDTLASIAAGHQVTWQELAESNKLLLPDGTLSDIRVGQVLMVPVQAAASGPLSKMQAMVSKATEAYGPTDGSKGTVITVASVKQWWGEVGGWKGAYTKSETFFEGAVGLNYLGAVGLVVWGYVLGRVIVQFVVKPALQRAQDKEVKELAEKQKQRARERENLPSSLQVVATATDVTPSKTTAAGANEGVVETRADVSQGEGDSSSEGVDAAIRAKKNSKSTL